jgi:hypothetical protein
VIAPGGGNDCFRDFHAGERLPQRGKASQSANI